MTDPLPPYSGDSATCPKCRGMVIDVQYQRGIPTIVHGNGDHTLLSRDGDTSECLLRTCRDCDWAWLEACADAQPEQPSSPTRQLRACPACAASMAACFSKGGRCCAMCHHAPAGNPMRSSG